MLGPCPGSKPVNPGPPKQRREPNHYTTWPAPSFPVGPGGFPQTFLLPPRPTGAECSSSFLHPPAPPDHSPLPSGKRDLLAEEGPGGRKTLVTVSPPVPSTNRQREKGPQHGDRVLSAAPHTLFSAFFSSPGPPQPCQPTRPLCSALTKALGGPGEARGCEAHAFRRQARSQQSECISVSERVSAAPPRRHPASIRSQKVNTDCCGQRCDRPPCTKPTPRKSVPSKEFTEHHLHARQRPCP